MRTMQEWRELIECLRKRVDFDLQSHGARGSGRARFRKKWDFTLRCLEAIERGSHAWEVPLQRIACWLLRDAVAHGAWYNEFAPASGAGGGDRVDLVRRWQQTAPALDMLELKEWKAADTLEAVVTQSGRYALLVALLRERGVAPYHTWPKDLHTRVSILAPEDFFEDRGGVAQVNGFVSQASQSFEDAIRRYPALGHVKLEPRVVALAGEMTRERFAECFDHSALQACIAAQRGVDHPGHVLRADAIVELRCWLIDSLNRAGFQTA